MTQFPPGPNGSLTWSNPHIYSAANSERVLRSNRLSGGIIATHLKLVTGNPAATSGTRPDGRELHQLADRLIEAVRAGCQESAQDLVSRYELSPFGVAAVATWMSRAGLSEAEILAVMVKKPRPRFPRQRSSY